MIGTSLRRMLASCPFPQSGQAHMQSAGSAVASGQLMIAIGKIRQIRPEHIVRIHKPIYAPANRHLHLEADVATPIVRLMDLNCDGVRSRTEIQPGEIHRQRRQCVLRSTGDRANASVVTGPPGMFRRNASTPFTYPMQPSSHNARTVPSVWAA